MKIGDFQCPTAISQEVAVVTAVAKRYNSRVIF